MEGTISQSIAKTVNLACTAIALGGAALWSGCDVPASSAMSPAEIGLGTDTEAPAVEDSRDTRGIWPKPPEFFAMEMVAEGRRIFRHDTLGDEAFWGGELRLHEAIAGEANGGVGPGISPAAALALGLKVDVQALPWALRRDLRAGTVDLDDPATTLALLELDAIVGVTGFFDDAGQIESVGIQCALCHSVVDDSFAPGIGRLRDGWPNRQLDIGAIMAAAPNLSGQAALLQVDEDTLRTVLRGWGRGKFDPFVFLDGKLTRPDGGSAAVMIAPLFNLAGVGLMTWNGWSGLASWFPLVAILEMHGQGVFSDRRLGDAAQFPIAAANGLDRVRHDPDLVTSKLAPLHMYQLSLDAPPPPPGFYDPVAAESGREIFMTKGRCSNCHVPPLYTLPGWNLIPPAVIGVDAFQADRSPNHGYRPPPLRGLHTRTGGFFHDGRFATLDAVVDHFDATFGLALLPEEKHDLVEFLKSL